MTRETQTQRGTGRGSLTARLEGMSSVTSLLATSHSRYRIGRGRTLCVGCAQGTWREAPARRKSWPGGPAGSDLGKGHFPHRSCKRKEGQSGHLRTAEDSVHTQRISRRHRGPGSSCKASQMAAILPILSRGSGILQTSLTTQVYC